jgi:hypothetical protein
MIPLCFSLAQNFSKRVEVPAVSTIVLTLDFAFVTENVPCVDVSKNRWWGDTSAFRLICAFVHIRLATATWYPNGFPWIDPERERVFFFSLQPSNRCGHIEIVLRLSRTRIAGRDCFSHLVYLSPLVWFRSFYRARRIASSCLPHLP